MFLSDPQRSTGPARPPAYTAGTRLLPWPVLDSCWQKAVSALSKGYCGCRQILQWRMGRSCHVCKGAYMPIASGEGWLCPPFLLTP